MLTVLLFLASWVSWSQCLEVTNTSLCVDTCDGPSLTYSSDLSCSDDEYWNTANGVLFRSCLDCESTSSAESGDTSTPQNNDIYWFLCEGATPRYRQELTNSQREIYTAVLYVPGQRKHTKSASMRSRLCWIISSASDIVVFTRTCPTV
jgi:hypothetical protein